MRARGFGSNKSFKTMKTFNKFLEEKSELESNYDRSFLSNLRHDIMVVLDDNTKDGSFLNAEAVVDFLRSLKPKKYTKVTKKLVTDLLWDLSGGDKPDTEGVGIVRTKNKQSELLYRFPNC